jgi:serine/threonine protein kinase
VIDFGFSKTGNREGEDAGGFGALTMTGGFLGTPLFASPEQIEERDIDVRSHIYSLGATLYYMLTGRPPFSGSVGSVMSQLLYKPLPLKPLEGLPPQVIELVQSMMEKDPGGRPQTPLELEKEILNCLEQVKGSSPSATPGPRSALRERLAAGALIAQNYQIVRELGETPEGIRFIV